jgi:serine/threonine protein phosphatase PrpC
VYAYRSAPQPTRVAVAARTHAGAKQRSNLDAYFVSDFEGYLARDFASLCEPVTGRAAVAAAVFSGHFLDWSRSPGMADRAAEQGFRITRAAGDLLVSAFTAGGAPFTDVELRERLGQSMLSAGYGVYQAAQDPRFIDTAASCTLAVLQRDRLEIIQAGDTRGYLLRERRLSLVSQGASPDGFRPPIATRAPPLGVPTTALPPLYTLDLRAGDLVMLCSRGLSATLDEAILLHLLMSATSLDAAAKAVLDEAMRRRSEHNLTVVLIAPTA